MKIIKKYPIDLQICILISIIALLIPKLELSTLSKTIIGLPFIIFIPGYITIYALMPFNKIEKKINVIERTALSFGTSIVIIPPNQRYWASENQSRLFRFEYRPVFHLKMTSNLQR